MEPHLQQAQTHGIFPLSAWTLASNLRIKEYPAEGAISQSKKEQFDGSQESESNQAFEEGQEDGSEEDTVPTSWARSQTLKIIG